MDETSQSDAIAFLNRLCAEAGDDAPPALTHISRVFFAGPRVFKLKRAVRKPYLDFSSADLRCKACARELELNRATAPTLYIAVRSITREAQGLAFDGPGELVDCVVEMRRFDEALLLDRMAQGGALTPALMDALAQSIAAMHVKAQVREGDAHSLARVLAMNKSAVQESFLNNEPGCDALLAQMENALAQHSTLLNARASAGKVRRCHGDLTLRNIVLLEGAPIPFDCLEFDEELATTDVLYDLSFPIMDLWRAGLPALGNNLFNRYLDRADESCGLSLMPLFIAMRALVRAHVAANMADEKPEMTAEARSYFELARDAITPSAPELFAIGGLSGSGKSTLAATLAPMIAPMPGARILSSDRIRKALFGAPANTRLPLEAYTSEISARVYALMRELAAKCLDAGWPVIVDAVFDREEDRAAIQELAAARGLPFSGFWLQAPLQILQERVAARVNDPSDADVAVLNAQAARLAGQAQTQAQTWRELDASQPALWLAEQIAQKS
jgi:aminoglycoside phosphotransferase family enzyme/predicted kinase